MTGPDERPALYHGPALPAEPKILPPSGLDVGKVEHRSVAFPNWRGEADRPEAPPPAPLPPDERVGFAIIGLGRLALQEILPAFSHCGQARPLALVSGSPEKARLVAQQYGIPETSVYGYDEIHRLAENPQVQAVYVVTPNAVHLENVQAAAAAGKHVLCEKPMAVNSAQAKAMTQACHDAGVKLMIAYRCQYERYNRAAIDLVRSGEFGALRLIEASNLQMQGPADQWRLKGAMAGGGALPDIGLYCLNGARAVTGEEPIEVFARIQSPPGDARYKDIDQAISFFLRFPSGVMAHCAADYGAHETKDMRLRLEGGWIELENAFAYQGQRLRIARREGSHEAVTERRLGLANQFALEIEHFAQCIHTGTQPRTPGEEGVQDQLLMEALYRSAKEGIPVALEPVGRLDAFRGPPLEGAK